MKRTFVFLTFVLSACAPTDASYLTAPAVRIAIAQSQITITQQAYDETQRAPTQTAIALTQSAGSIAATQFSGAATATQMGIDSRATLTPAALTQAARLTATQAPIVAEMTRQAGAEALLRFNQRQQFILTQAAGEAQAEAQRWKATSVGVWILILFGSLSVGILLLALAVRVAGPDLISFGEGVSRVIMARANSYSTRRAADYWIDSDAPDELPGPIAAGEDWHVGRWKRAALMFLTAGDKYGFTIRALGAAGGRVVTDPGWNQMKDWLIGLGILADNNGTGWAAEWDIERFHRGYPAWNPTPPPGQPPEVAAVVRGATTLQRSTTLPEGG